MRRLIFPLVYYICHTSPRYRHPIDPVMAILLRSRLLTACCGMIQENAPTASQVSPAPQIRRFENLGDDLNERIRHNPCFLA